MRSFRHAPIHETRLARWLPIFTCLVAGSACHTAECSDEESAVTITIAFGDLEPEEVRALLVETTLENRRYWRRFDLTGDINQDRTTSLRLYLVPPPGGPT